MEINNDPLAGECVFLAEDAGVDLINELVGPYTADKAYPIASYISRFTADSGFKIGVNEISNLNRKLEWESEESTALARILSVATQFDNAELEFRFEVNGLEVVERYIDIFKKRGKDERVTLYVDKDINRITTSGNIYDLGTSLVGIGGTPEGQDNPINLKGYKYTDPDGRYVLGSDGIMRDTVAVQKWSRLLSNDNQAPKSSHIQRRKTYETTDQKTLCDDVLRDLKKMAEVELNYEAEIVSMPYGVKIGDTIYLVDEQGELYLSARVLELVRCYSEDRYLATLGNYLIKDSGVDVNLQEIADKLKDQIKPGDTYYPWTRYADDANGTGMSGVPDGKTYMATIHRKNDPIASDNPEDYAGQWVKIKGDDGDDGQTPVVHPAWSWSADGTDRFTTVYPMENLVTMDSLGRHANASVSNVTFIGPGRVNINSDGRNYIGFYTAGRQYQLSTRYSMKFKMVVNSGSVISIGGHTTYTYSIQDASINGVSQSLNWANGINYNFENNKEYTVSIVFTTRDTEAMYTEPSAGIYIQPNRMSYGTAFDVDISELKIEEGATPTIYTPAPSEDYANAYPLYEGTYSDYSETASTNPTDYTWRRIIGESGQDGNNGADGVGIANTKIDYQLHTSATTPPTGTWVASPPAVTVGKYLWTRTILEYTDGTKATPAYSVSGGPGANGSDGKDGQDGAPGVDALPIFSGYVTNEAIVLMATNSGAVSDFSKATGTFVTYLGQDQLTSGVTYSRVSQSGVTATINTTTGAYSVTAASADSGMVVFKAVYQGIELQKIVSVTKAKQGAVGATGAPGADGATGDTGPQGPPTGVVAQDTVPDTPYIGMLWQCTGNIAGYINPATYRWNGSAWEIYQFTAQNILAETFTGFVFRGVEFIGSKFVSEFRYPIGDGQYYYADGTTTIDNGGIVTDLVEHYPTDPEEYDESFSRHIELSPENALYMKLKGLRSDLSQEIQLSPGGLMLKTNELMATLTVENIYSLVRPARRNTSPADDTNRKGVVVNYFRVGNLVNVAIRFELLKDTGWIALAPMPPSGYAPASMYQASGVAGSISYRGQTCMVYCNSDGLRLIPTTGQGTGVFQLSLTWTTTDPFPYGDS
ncbi:phage tail protein [Enterococcus asini]|uniref:phage tail protein n=1 Tax=Enterococcus asini TaxID=57732 RepID=UPI002892B26F|nr:hypothetical protein [Enterococcus asini]